MTRSGFLWIKRSAAREGVRSTIRRGKWVRRRLNQSSQVQTCRAVLPAEEQLGGRAHHLGAPHRLECELGVHGLDTLYGERLCLDLLLDQIPNGAHRAGEAEGDVDMTPLVMHADVIDQAELDEVHPDLRVYNIPQLVLYALLGYHSLTSCRHPFSTLIVKPRGRLSTRAAVRACPQVSALRLPSACQHFSLLFSPSTSHSWSNP